MMSIPKISVIVPIYNAEKHLNRCVSSILSQTFVDLELLLIDDGSRDNSKKKFVMNMQKKTAESECFIN